MTGFEQKKAENNTDYRDWAFLYTAKDIVGFPLFFSREANKLQPIDHDTWTVENREQADNRAKRLAELGLLRWHREEVRTTTEGVAFLDYLIKKGSFKPNRYEPKEENSDSNPNKKNRVRIVLALIPVLGAIVVALITNWDKFNLLTTKENSTTTSGIENYIGDWSVSGSFGAGTYRGVFYEAGSYTGEVSRIEKRPNGFVWYNTQESDPEEHLYLKQGNKYTNDKYGETIRFTSDTTAIQIMCCNRGTLNLIKL